MSPFGIDTLEPATNPFPKHYGFLKSVSQLVLDAQTRPASSIGLYFDELAADGTNSAKSVIQKWGGYEITIERCLVFGKAGLGAGMVIHRGFQVRARSPPPISGFTGFPRFEEMVVADQDTERAAHTAGPGLRRDPEWDLPYDAEQGPGIWWMPNLCDQPCLYYDDCGTGGVFD